MLLYTKAPEPLPKEGKEYEYRHEGIDLLRALYAVYSRGGKTVDTREISAAIPHRIVYSVRDKSRQILTLLRAAPLGLRELYRSCATRGEVVAAFMSVLELCSMGSVRLQRREDGDYEASFVGGDVDEIIEKIVE